MVSSRGLAAQPQPNLPNLNFPNLAAQTSRPPSLSLRARGSCARAVSFKYRKEALLFRSSTSLLMSGSLGQEQLGWPSGPTKLVLRIPPGIRYLFLGCSASKQEIERLTSLRELQRRERGPQVRVTSVVATLFSCTSYEGRSYGPSDHSYFLTPYLLRFKLKRIRSAEASYEKKEYGRRPYNFFDLHFATVLPK